MKSKLIKILVIGIVLRLVLAATTFHYDIRAFDFGRHLISQGHLVDFYDYLGTLPADNPLLKDYPANYFIYPPLIYAYHGLWGMVGGVFFSPDFKADFLFNLTRALTNGQIFGYLLMLKLSYLVFDLLAAWFLARLFDKPRDQLLAFGLWVFNPVTLYATYMMGQFDVIPTFLVILSAYLAKQGRWGWAAFSLGLGASFKIYPLFLVIPLMTLLPSLVSRVRVGGMAAVGYLLPVVPFLWSAGFRSSALVAGQTLKSFYAQIPISGGEALIIFLGLLVLAYLSFWYGQARFSLEWRYLVVLVMLLSLTHFHPQWFLWVTPWLIVALIRSQLRYLLVVGLILLAYVGEILLYESGLNIGLFATFNPALLESPSLWQVSGVGLELNLARSVMQTVLVASMIFLVYHQARFEAVKD